MRIPPQPVEVRHNEAWYPGTLHSWDIDTHGHASGVVSFVDERNDVHVGRFREEQIRDTPAGD